MTDPLKALFGKPDYSHIVRDTTATISITAVTGSFKPSGLFPPALQK